MTTRSFVPVAPSGRRIALAEIGAAVSARLGPTRALGNSQPACFNRLIAMYLASHIGRWSTTIIGRFYNGRDHSTVCHGIQRIESLRESDSELDALITDLKHQLVARQSGGLLMDITDQNVRSTGASQQRVEELADLVAERVWNHLQLRLSNLLKEG